MELQKRTKKHKAILKAAEQQHQKDLRRLRDLRPIDDDFMRCMFKNNIPLAEFVLRMITGMQELTITDCETQKDMKRLAGARSVCLDAYGTDSTGKRYDLEIQRQEKGADPHRARYHSSVMDVENLHSGQEFKELPDTYTIFITEKDFYGKGKPVYPIERMNLVTGKSFEDGEHILYVNGEYRGESEGGGVSEMCRILEDMRNESLKEGIKKGAVNTAKKMLADGTVTLEKIAEFVGLSVDEVKKIETGQTI